MRTRTYRCLVIPKKTSPPIRVIYIYIYISTCLRVPMRACMHMLHTAVRAVRYRRIFRVHMSGRGGLRESYKIDNKTQSL